MLGGEEQIDTIFNNYVGDGEEESALHHLQFLTGDGNYSEAIGTADFNQYLPSSISDAPPKSQPFDFNVTDSEKESTETGMLLLNNIKQALQSSESSANQNRLLNETTVDDDDNDDDGQFSGFPPNPPPPPPAAPDFQEPFFNFNDTFKTHLSKAEYDLFNQYPKSGQHVKFPYTADSSDAALSSAPNLSSSLQIGDASRQEEREFIQNGGQLNLSSEVLFLDQESNNLHDSISSNSFLQKMRSPAQPHRPLTSNNNNNNQLSSSLSSYRHNGRDQESSKSYLEKNSFVSPTYLTGVSTSPLSLDNMDGFKEIFFDELNLHLNDRQDELSFDRGELSSYATSASDLLPPVNPRDFEKTPSFNSALNGRLTSPVTAIKVSKHPLEYKESSPIGLPIFESLELPPSASAAVEDADDDVEVERSDNVSIGNFGADLHNSLGSFGRSTVISDANSPEEHENNFEQFETCPSSKLEDLIESQRREFMSKNGNGDSSTLKMNTWQKEEREKEMLFSPGEFFGIKSCQMGDLEGMKPDLERVRMT